MRYRSSPNSFIWNILNENREQKFLDLITTASNHEREERFFKQQKKSEYDLREFQTFQTIYHWRQHLWSRKGEKHQFITKIFHLSQRIWHTVAVHGEFRIPVVMSTQIKVIWIFHRLLELWIQLVKTSSGRIELQLDFCSPWLLNMVNNSTYLLISLFFSTCSWFISKKSSYVFEIDIYWQLTFCYWFIHPKFVMMYDDLTNWRLHLISCLNLLLIRSISRVRLLRLDCFRS